MRLTNNQRKNLSKYFFNISALTYVTLIISQFISNIKFDFKLFVMGFLIAFFLVFLGLIFDK